MKVIQLIGVPDRNYQAIKTVLEQWLSDTVMAQQWMLQEVTSIDQILRYDICQVPAVAMDGLVIWEYGEGNLLHVLHDHLAAPLPYVSLQPASSVL